MLWPTSSRFDVRVVSRWRAARRRNVSYSSWRGAAGVAVAAEVEEDGAPLARLAGGQRLVNGGADGVGGLRRGQDALRAGELERRVEDCVLGVGGGPHWAGGAGV